MEDRSDDFWRQLMEFYAAHGRHDMLWRRAEPDGSFNPYKILVSELMLQQTQVSRVAPKFSEFLAAFPTIQSLASARLGDVLRVWSGLGYNRRAKFLWQAAQMVQNDSSGTFPHGSRELQKLPGIGPNTAGALMAYAYDEPVVYVETNIRTVIIHHFFGDETGIPDKTIREVLEGLMSELDARAELSPRQFYWAMMDYGAFLKKSVGNLNRASKSYSRQSDFHGSRRQVRGSIIRVLADRPYPRTELIDTLSDERTEAVLDELITEGLAVQDGLIVRLA
jgi:A/G-specific adenine glycosylase